MNDATHRLPGLTLVDHVFELPLDHDGSTEETIEVFGREAVAAGREREDLPWLLFFQGGPGFPAPRPDRLSGWLKRALQEYRVLLLDQRGTGRSSPVTAQTLAHLLSPEEQAAYLKRFRADAIVDDAEAIRRTLLGEDRRWTVLGQSYGGFCALRYLSAAPHGVERALFTGGLPSLDRPAEDVYRATYLRVRQKNDAYYARYPEDEGTARRIADRLRAHDVRLADGDRLSPRRFQQLGLAFGASDGFEQVHYLLEEAFARTPQGDEISTSFLRHFDQRFSFQTHPIFAVLHEAIYAQGAATRWAAHRVRSDFPEFDAAQPGRLLFTGEMIYPWMFAEYRELRPLREAADLLANYDGWPDLYDLEALAVNEVPCAAAIYVDDMYVERTFSEETAARVRGMRTWVTNEFEHNGLRSEGERVLGRLLDLVNGRA